MADSFVILMLMATKTNKSKSKKRPSQLELDSVFIFKLVLFMILGSQWLYITNDAGNQLPLPVGAIIGIAFALHEHFRIDRKIEYAALLISMFIGFWLPIGITLVQ